MSGKLLLNLINDILDLSKIETGKIELYPETFNPLEVLQQACETVEPMRLKNSNTLELELPDSMSPCFNDATKFRQIIVNLLSNACKFTSTGCITVSAEERHDQATAGQGL